MNISKFVSIATISLVAVTPMQANAKPPAFKVVVDNENNDPVPVRVKNKAKVVVTNTDENPLPVTDTVKPLTRRQIFSARAFAAIERNSLNGIRPEEVSIPAGANLLTGVSLSVSAGANDTGEDSLCLGGITVADIDDFSVAIGPTLISAIGVSGGPGNVFRELNPPIQLDENTRVAVTISARGSAFIRCDAIGTFTFQTE